MIHCYPCKILLVFDSSHCAFPGCRFFDTSIYRLRARNHIPGVLPRLTPQSAINIPTSSAVSRSRTQRQAERDRPNGKRSSERSIPQKSISDTVGKAVLLLFMTAYFVALLNLIICHFCEGRSRQESSTRFFVLYVVLLALCVS